MQKAGQMSERAPLGRLSSRLCSINIWL